MTANKEAAPVSATGSGSQRHLFSDSIPSRTAQARNVSRDSIRAAGVPPFQGVAILAAADSYAKARVVNALADRIDTEPVDGGAE